MSINQRAALSPEMLLFEIAAMCTRHGLRIPANTNPLAARHYAEQLMRALGLVSDEPAGELSAAPALTESTTHLPVIRDGAFVAPGHPWRERVMRGAHRASRPLAAVPPHPNGGA